MNAPVSPQERESFVDVPSADTGSHLLGQLLQQTKLDAPAPPLTAVAVGVFHGFDLRDRPLVRGIAALPGEIVVARSTVALSNDMRDAPIVLVFESGDPYRPIVLGVISASPIVQAPAERAASVRVDDGERLVLCAEREVELRCGDASITLTRAGKVVIRGRQILSAATGYNRIKGAAIDIN